MLEDVAIAISTGAAGNIVAYMLTDQMGELRAQVAKIFRHGTGQQREAALRALERDANALREHNAIRAALTSQWGNILLSYLTDHPEARADVESFASCQATGGAVSIGSQIHVGTGPQIGRDHIGSMSFGGTGRNG
jgi:hypothetical protein